MPAITILTPFKNAAEHIVETAASIFDQSFQDWECILINDHSDENEEELLKFFLSDPRVKLVQNTGKGIRDALVTGFEITKGDHITRMDADDIMPQKKLSVFLDELNDPGVDIVTGKVRYFSDSGTISPGYLKYEGWLNERVDCQDFYKEIYRECSLSSGNWMMRTHRLKECGGFDGLVYPEDYDLLFRWYSNGMVIRGIDEVTHFWREHPKRTSRNSKDYSQQRFFDLKIRRFVQQDMQNTPLILNGTGAKGRLTAKVLLEKGIDFEWVSIEPEKFKAGVYGVRIIGATDVIGRKDLQILNAAAIDENSIKSLYLEMNTVFRVINL